MPIPQIPDWRQRILLAVGTKPTPENLRYMDASVSDTQSNVDRRVNALTNGRYGNVIGALREGDPTNYRSIARQIAVQQGINPDFFVSQIGAESNFDPNARSPAGALGIAQIVPKWHPGVDTSDPIASLTYAASHMATLLKKYGGDWRQALSVYNSGRPDKWSDPSFASGQTYNYVRKILGDDYTPGAAPAASAPPAGSTPAGGAQLQLPGAPSLLPSSTSGAAPATQTQATETPLEAMNRRTVDILNQANMSPAAVRLMANLGDATKLVAEARRDWDVGSFGFDPDNEPVPRTLTTLQTGSTDSKYKNLDLAVDFDGPIHPNANPIVAMAQQFLGTPYLWGGADPRKGFDCSGFVQYLYSQAGISLGRTTYDQVKQGQVVEKVGQLLPGDVVFFAQDGDVHHEGLYIGGGQFIHAPHTGDVVKISSLSEKYYASQFIGGRRFIAPGATPPA